MHNFDFDASCFFSPSDLPKKHSATAAFLAVGAFLALFLACLSTDNLLSAIRFELACGNVVQAFALRDYWIPVGTSNAFLPASCALKFVTFQVHEFLESFIIAAGISAIELLRLIGLQL